MECLCSRVQHSGGYDLRWTWKGASVLHSFARRDLSTGDMIDSHVERLRSGRWMDDDGWSEKNITHGTVEL